MTNPMHWVLVLLIAVAMTATAFAPGREASTRWPEAPTTRSCALVPSSMVFSTRTVSCVTT